MMNLEDISPVKWKVHQVNEQLVHNISDTSPEEQINTQIAKLKLNLRTKF